MNDGRLSLVGKLGLGLRVWRSFVRVRLGMGRDPLPVLVSKLGRAGRSGTSMPPRRLGVVVQRALTIGGHPPRCLISSLVLYDLLRGEGEDATLVIGLPHTPSTKDAHAWVEVAGTDVGPPPGRGTHEELARYGP